MSGVDEHMSMKKIYLVRVSYLTKVEGDDEFDALASAVYGTKYGTSETQELSTTVIAMLERQIEEKPAEVIEPAPSPSLPNPDPQILEIGERPNDSDVPF